MIEPWFDANHYAWIPGTCIGILGGIIGPLMGMMAPRGKWKPLVLGVHIGATLFCILLLIVGILAWIAGQPYGVWYGLGFPGLLGAVIFGCLLPLTVARYRQAELRRSMAQDL